MDLPNNRISHRHEIEEEEDNQKKSRSGEIQKYETQNQEIT